MKPALLIGRCNVHFGGNVRSRTNTIRLRRRPRGLRTFMHRYSRAPWRGGLQQGWARGFVCPDRNGAATASQRV